MVVEEQMHNNANINKETPKTESWMLKLGAHIFKRPLAKHGGPTQPKLNPM